LEKADCPAWACAILLDHVHLVLGRPRVAVENVVIQLKGAATKKLTDEGIHPCAELTRANQRPPKCFGRGEWSVYLDPPDVARAVKYVEDNPMKEGKPRQRSRFVEGHPY
jgi:REP element-mobilizing transposase RayT